MAKKRPLECLIGLGEKRNRSVNYLGIEAISKHLNWAEKKE